MQLIPKNQRSTTLFKTFWKKTQTLVEHIIYYYLFKLQSLFSTTKFIKKTRNSISNHQGNGYIS